MNVNDFDFQKYVDLAIPYGIKIVLALVIFVVGLSVIKILSGMLKRTMTARNVDPTIEKFVGSIAYYLMFAFVVIASLGQLGVQTASVIAILGAAGLAVGLALQGTLSNFAAGVMMMEMLMFDHKLRDQSSELEAVIMMLFTMVRNMILSFRSRDRSVTEAR